MSATLHFRKEGSDKIYRVAIEPQGAGYVVNFAHGPRGSMLQNGTKTLLPVFFENAERMFDHLVRKRLAEGYVLDSNSVADTHDDMRVTSLRPQLPNAVDDVAPLLEDNKFYLQPKHDGKRLLLHKQGQDVTGINRRGIECAIPEWLRVAALALSGDFLLDGESVKDTLHAFDVLELEGTCIRHIPYRSRLMKLLLLLGSGEQSGIRWVETVAGASAKRRAFDQLREEKAEGVVFKRVGASYSPGRPNTGGDHFKFKFVETASVMISEIHSERSVQMAVWDGGSLVPAGSVTVPPDHHVPEVGDIAEIRYEHALAGCGSLFQPVYLGVRDDILPAECTRDQFKFRKEPEEAAA